jgi:hypothetical protein
MDKENIMRRKLFWFLCALAMFAFFGCAIADDDDDDDASDGKDDGIPTVVLAKLSITDANNLFIAPAGSTSRAVLDTSKLFKITDDGYVQEVSYLGKDGETVTMSSQPTAIYNVDAKYVIICFGRTDGYLVRKSDGAVFSLCDVGIPLETALQCGNFTNAEKILTDADGCLYYQTGTSTADLKVIRIDVTDPDNLTKADYSPTTDAPIGFWVTAEGHMVYNFGNGSSNRIRKSNGGLYNLPSCTWMPFWIGLDGKIKYQFGSTSVVTVNIDSSFAVTTEETPGVVIGSGLTQFLLRFPERTLIVGEEGIKEVENPTGVPRIVPVAGIASIKNVEQSSDYYYLSGTDSSNNPLLLKVNPENDSVTTLLGAGLYEVYKMTVSSGNVVVFNALRMSDGAKILGEISAAGAVTILDETLNSEVVSLERIN